jgi:hypothetical protein
MKKESERERGFERVETKHQSRTTSHKERETILTLTPSALAGTGGQSETKITAELAWGKRGQLRWIEITSSDMM